MLSISLESASSFSCDWSFEVLRETAYMDLYVASGYGESLCAWGERENVIIDSRL